MRDLLVGLIVAVVIKEIGGIVSSGSVAESDENVGTYWVGVDNFAFLRAMVQILFRTRLSCSVLRVSRCFRPPSSAFR